MKTVLYSPLLMDGKPVKRDDGTIDWDVLHEWRNYDLLVMSLGSLVRNRDVLEAIRKMCPAPLLGYGLAFTSCYWLNEAAMKAEPEAMTSRQRQVGIDHNAIVGAYLDITVPGVTQELLGIWVEGFVQTDVDGLFPDCAFKGAPFSYHESPRWIGRSQAELDVVWEREARLLLGTLRSVCYGKRAMVPNPPWYQMQSGVFSERWDDLTSGDPISFVMNGPGRHTHDMIFTCFDPAGRWPTDTEIDRYARYGAACATLTDSYFALGPSDLNWKPYQTPNASRFGDRRYWTALWRVPEMKLKLGPPIEKPSNEGNGRWNRRMQGGTVAVDVRAKTARFEDLAGREVCPAR